MVFSICKIGLEREQAPSIAHLNDLPGNMPWHTRHLVYFVLFAAKISIAGTWKSPSVSVRMKHKVSWLMLHEKVASIIIDETTEII